MHYRKTVWIKILVICGLINQAYPIPAEVPTWLIFEKAVLEMDRGEYGNALHLFLQAQEKKRIYPEVEIAVGDIYKIQGEIILAEKQYLKAYDQKDAFEVPEDKYTALYRLVRLYKEQQDYIKWAKVLDDVLREDQDYYRDRFERLYDTFLKVYLESGMDRLLVLYRLEGKHATYAHGELGEHFNRSYVNTLDRTKKRQLAEYAMVHYLFASVTLFTDVIDEIRFWDPKYRFTDLTSLFAALVVRRNLYDYLGETEIFKYLYYLAVASYTAGYEERADEIWRVLEAEQQAGRYGNLSRSQLSDPWVAPLLYID